MSSVLDRAGLDALVDALVARGYRVIGPTVRDDAIVLAELSSGAQLPDGWGVEVAPGSYRLRRRSDTAVFAHSAGQQSWKQFLHPPRQRLWSTDGTTFTEPAAEDPKPMAFLGVRACDLAAIAVLGNVLGAGNGTDTAFARRTDGLLVIAVGCTEPGGLCFCASAGTGPNPQRGYDLSLTERIDDDGPRYIVTVGTPAGEQVLEELSPRPASQVEVDDAEAALDAAADRMGRELPSLDLRTLLRDGRESTIWQDVAERCLTCGNCTMVCPTCFCTTTEDRHEPRRRHLGSDRAVGILLRTRLLLPARRQCARHRREPLPAVDHAQAVHVARPVRHLGLCRLRPMYRVVPRGHRHHRGSCPTGNREWRRAMTTGAELGHFAVLAGLSDARRDLLAAGARSVVYNAGDQIFDEGRPADRWWLICSGQVELVTHRPAGGAETVATLGSGDLLGWSWAVAPFRWRFGAVANDRVTAFEFDAARLREAIDQDPALGYELMLRLLEALAERLHATRARLLDLYASPRDE